MIGHSRSASMNSTGWPRMGNAEAVLIQVLCCCSATEILDFLDGIPLAIWRVPIRGIVQS